MKFEELISAKEGDILTLSDFQTQEQFNKTEVDFRILSVRTYEEPGGAFSYKGFIVSPPDAEDDDKYMILLMQCGDVTEIRVYYLDTEGELFKAEEGQEECPLYVLLDIDNDRLQSRIEAHVVTDDDERDVTWDCQDQTHGVRFEDGEDEGICTLGDFFTEEDNRGNNYCLIDWRGDAVAGWVEVWYGCIIKEHEIEILPSESE